MLKAKLYQVAISGPFLKGLTYKLDNPSVHNIIGCRVTVPLGSRTLIGVVVHEISHTTVATNKLKSIITVVDETPFFDEGLFKLLLWVHDYYHAPLGEVFQTAMPAHLIKGAPFSGQTQSLFVSTDEGLNTPFEALINAPKQQQCLVLLQKEPKGLTLGTLKSQGISANIVKALLNKKLIIETHCDQLPAPCEATESSLTLNSHQQQAYDQIINTNTLESFQVTLLNGITGSGKTEVYMQVIAKVLAKGKQVLILVPEISLTPQTLARFQRRFNVVVAVVHSKLTDTERLNQAYYSAKGHANIIIGTRSSVFLPIHDLGLIVVDEEHDLSYKQQSGLRYHARDVAIMRAKMADIPIILGSATPAMESYHNATCNRYQLLELPTRAGSAREPHFHLIDLKKQALRSGLSLPLIEAMREQVKDNHQVLLFLNRRGYAPVLMCHDCSWSAKCQRCDTFLTLHKQPVFLSCHHCGVSQRLIKQCPDCDSLSIGTVGEGTEKIEEALQGLFPDKNILRIDRSTASQKGQLDALLTHVHDHSADILIGTQMLAKGHHFKDVTMVGIINVDQGLFSTDFRAIERVGQIISQVAGRAGRDKLQGNVYIQTHQPEHPLLLTLLKSGYNAFLHEIIKDRQQTHWPPFSHLALVRAEAHQKSNALDYLTNVKNRFKQEMGATALSFMGPTPALMPKKSGLYRAQLLLRSNSRATLKSCVVKLNQHLFADKNSRVRWSIDVDPQEFG